MIRRLPRSTPLYSSAASDVYKRQLDVLPTARARADYGCYRPITRSDKGQQECSVSDLIHTSASSIRELSSFNLPPTHCGKAETSDTHQKERRQTVDLSAKPGWTLLAGLRGARLISSALILAGTLRQHLVCLKSPAGQVVTIHHYLHSGLIPECVRHLARE